MFGPKLVAGVLVLVQLLQHAAAAAAAHQVEEVPGGYAELGEAFHWDAARQSMYYTDVMEGRLLRYDHAEDTVYACRMEPDSLPSFILPVAGQSQEFVVGSGSQICLVRWDGRSKRCSTKRVLYDLYPRNSTTGMRLNAGICDRNGDLLSGTMLHHLAGDSLLSRDGILFRFSARRRGPPKLKVLARNIGISNSLAFDAQDNLFYYIDTLDYNIKEFDYTERGNLGQARIVYDVADNADVTYLDGMTIDTQGQLYVTFANKNTVSVIDPKTQSEIWSLEFPCDQISSAGFGGPAMDELWVATTAINGRTAPCGTVYRVTGMNATGVPPHKMCL